MKKTILIALSFFALSKMSLAQETSKVHDSKENVAKQERTPEMMAQKNVDDINSMVTLTEDQKPKVYTICLEKVTKVKEIREKYKGQPEAREKIRSEANTVKEEYHKKLKGILTPEQLEKMKAARAEKKEEAKTISQPKEAEMK